MEPIGGKFYENKNSTSKPPISNKDTELWQLLLHRENCPFGNRDSAQAPAAGNRPDRCGRNSGGFGFVDSHNPRRTFVEDASRHPGALELQGGSVLVWLQGDERIIRDDARVFFRPADLPDDQDMDWHRLWKDGELKYADADSEIDPEEGDYARVLELINEFLPVKELTGRLIGLPVLRQFGLVENEKFDRFLAEAFGHQEEPTQSATKGPKEKRRRRDSNRNAKVVPPSQDKK
ncbi:MAG: hypothetical protein ABSE48_03900 [Verrucomicrobiota bacterium]|jgi:hypothetical protein